MEVSELDKQVVLEHFAEWRKELRHAVNIDSILMFSMRVTGGGTHKFRGLDQADITSLLTADWAGSD